MSDPTPLTLGTEAPADAPAARAGGRTGAAVRASGSLDRETYAPATSRGYSEAMGRGIELALTLVVVGGIGWLVDLFLIPGMDRDADLRFRSGAIDYSVAWLLLTFLGLFGVHRMYQGKWVTGILYLFTGGFFLLGILYDFWTMNEQISVRNASQSS